MKTNSALISTVLTLLLSSTIITLTSAFRRHLTSEDRVNIEAFAIAAKRRRGREVDLEVEVEVEGGAIVSDDEDSDEGGIAARRRRRKLKEIESESEIPCPSNHLVTSLPGLSPGNFKTKHYAGHVPVKLSEWSTSNGGSKNMLFYWLFSPSLPNGEPMSKEELRLAPVLIWLNGGPGCSSMDGLFLENGPFKIFKTNNSVNIKINEYSWHRSGAYVLYVDQPVGTGLSFSLNGKYCGSDSEVNDDFYGFLQNLLTIYDGATAKSGSGTGGSEGGSEGEDEEESVNLGARDFYFSGESHAGHYIPSMISSILKRNTILKSSGTIVPSSSSTSSSSSSSSKSYMNSAGERTIRVKGMAIGNGWVSPYHQYSATPHAYASGILGLPETRYFDASERQCHSKMEGGNLHSSECFRLLDDVVEGSRTKDNFVVSMYDNRLMLKSQSEFPPGARAVEEYLGGSDSVKRRAVLNAVHASRYEETGKRFKECTEPPFYALSSNDGAGVLPDLVHVLEHSDGVRVLFFNGMNDMICNHIGNELFLDTLPWNNIDQYLLAKRTTWDGFTPTSTVPPASGVGVGVSKPAGYYKNFRNLGFLKIREAGHMVMLDQPFVSLNMISTFLSNGSFGSRTQAKMSSLLPSPSDASIVPPVPASAPGSCPIAPLDAVTNVDVNERSCDKGSCTLIITFAIPAPSTPSTPQVSIKLNYIVHSSPPLSHVNSSGGNGDGGVKISGSGDVITVMEGVVYTFVVQANTNTDTNTNTDLAVKAYPSNPTQPKSFGCNGCSDGQGLCLVKGGSPACVCSSGYDGAECEVVLDLQHGWNGGARKCHESKTSSQGVNEGAMKIGGYVESLMGVALLCTIGVVVGKRIKSRGGGGGGGVKYIPVHGDDFDGGVDGEFEVDLAEGVGGGEVELVMREGGSI